MTMHPDPWHPVRAFDDPALVTPPRPLPVAPPEPAAVCPGSLAIGVCLGLVFGIAIATPAMLRLL
jgi:hypothetical protein